MHHFSGLSPHPAGPPPPLPSPHDPGGSPLRERRALPPHHLGARTNRSRSRAAAAAAYSSLGCAPSLTAPARRKPRPLPRPSTNKQRPRGVGGAVSRAYGPRGGSRAPRAGKRSITWSRGATPLPVALQPRPRPLTIAMATRGLALRRHFALRGSGGSGTGRARL